MPKIDYFGSKSSKLPSVGGFAPRLPDSRLGSMTGKCAKNLLPLNIFG